MTYESGKLTPFQKENFVKFIDDKIGVEYEIDNPNTNKFVVTVVDLLPVEVELVRDFENHNIDESYEKFYPAFQFKGSSTKYVAEAREDYVEAEDNLIIFMKTLKEITGHKAVQYNAIASNIDKHTQDYFIGALHVKVDDVKTVVEQYVVDLDNNIKENLLRNDSFVYNTDMFNNFEKNYTKINFYQEKEILVLVEELYGYRDEEWDEVSKEEFIEIINNDINIAREIAKSQILEDARIKLMNNGFGESNLEELIKEYIFSEYPIVYHDELLKKEQELLKSEVFLSSLTNQMEEKLSDTTLEDSKRDSINSTSSQVK